jgi:hypothetical protein
MQTCKSKLGHVSFIVEADAVECCRKFAQHSGRLSVEGFKDLFSVMAKAPDMETVQLRGLGALYDLTSAPHSPNVPSFKEAGGSKFIIGLAAVWINSAPVQKEVCKLQHILVRGLSRHHVHTLVRDGGLDGGLTCTLTAMGRHPRVLGLQLWACVLLHSLVLENCQVNQVRIVENGGAPLVCAAIKEGMDNVVLVRKACDLILELAKGIPVCVQALKDAEAPACIAAAMNMWPTDNSVARCFRVFSA